MYPSRHGRATVRSIRSNGPERVRIVKRDHWFCCTTRRRGQARWREGWIGILARCVSVRESSSEFRTQDIRAIQGSGLQGVFGVSARNRADVSRSQDCKLGCCTNPQVLGNHMLRIREHPGRTAPQEVYGKGIAGWCSCWYHGVRCFAQRSAREYKHATQMDWVTGESSGGSLLTML